MPSTATDRLYGLSSSVAVKAPCRLKTTANHGLSGLAAIDGVTPVARDRILVGSQTDTTENGIWIAQSGAWSRAADFDGTYDAVGGTQVLVTSGTVSASTYWMVEGEGEVVIGTDAITIVEFLIDDLSTSLFSQNITGALDRPMLEKMREEVSVLDFMTSTERTSVLASNFTVDVTAAIQTAIDRLADGTIGSLYFPDGGYRISAAITKNQAVMTGWHVYGQSRAKTIIKQMTANTPIFQFTVNLMHTIEWSSMSFTWNTVQTGNTSATVFSFLTGGGARSVYNSSFHNLFAANSYWFMRGETALFWGNSVRDVWCSTIGGFVNLYGTAGQPKNVFDNIYINGGLAGEYQFRVGAMIAEYFVEINASNAGQLIDEAGGKHHIRHWALEVANFTTNTTLFKTTNSTLICGGSIEFATVTVAAAITVIGFSTSGDGVIDVNTFTWGGWAMGAGSVFYVCNSGGATVPARFKRIRGPFTVYGATPIQSLTDFGSTSTAGGGIVVEEWNDPVREQFVIDADATLTFDNKMTVIFGKALTAARKIIMPPHGSSQGQNMYQGRMFDIIKLASAGVGFDINIFYSDGVTLLKKIPAAAVSARISIRFDRADPAGGGGLGFYTVVPNAGLVPTDTGWTADTGATSKAALGTLATAPGAAYVQAEAVAVANGLIELQKQIVALKAAVRGGGIIIT